MPASECLNNVAKFVVIPAKAHHAKVDHPHEAGDDVIAIFILNETFSDFLMSASPIAVCPDLIRA
jgi:hypothetical protein